MKKSFGYKDVNIYLTENKSKSTCIAYNSHKNSIFICEGCGDEFPRLWSNVRRTLKKGKSVLCRKCGKKPDWNIKTIGELSSKEHLVLLSTEYVGIYDPLEWRCPCGEIFNRSWGHILHKKRYRCKTCVDGVGVEWDIDKVTKLSENMGLIPLSTSYINQNHKMDWLCRKCGEPHKKSWRDTIEYPNGQCKKCNKKTEWDLDMVNQTCVNKGVRCLSNEYINFETEMSFECSCGNLFVRTWRYVSTRDGFECNDCSKGHKDGKVARYAKQSFKDSFSNVICEAKLIKNPSTGGWMYYDILVFFNSKKYIIEIHGSQHYRFEPKYHKNQQGFEKSKQRDIIKKQWAIDNNYIFIEVDTRKHKNKYIDSLIQKILKGEI